jgi:hypothetical protein
MRITIDIDKFQKDFEALRDNYWKNRQTKQVYKWIAWADCQGNKVILEACPDD